MVTQPVTVMLGFEQEQPSYSCSLFLDPLTHAFSPTLPGGFTDSPLNTGHYAESWGCRDFKDMRPGRVVPTLCSL